MGPNGTGRKNEPRAGLGRKIGILTSLFQSKQSESLQDVLILYSPSFKAQYGDEHNFMFNKYKLKVFIQDNTQNHTHIIYVTYTRIPQWLNLTNNKFHFILSGLVYY